MFEVVSLLHHAFLGYECSIWVNSKRMKVGLAVWSDLVKCFCTFLCVIIYIYIYIRGFNSFLWRCSKGAGWKWSCVLTLFIFVVAIQVTANQHLAYTVLAQNHQRMGSLRWPFKPKHHVPWICFELVASFFFSATWKGDFLKGLLWNNDLLWVLKHLRRSRSWPGSCDGSGTIAVSTIALWIRIA